jgi:deazaflavin-dependent oxidoreductase (nitroreductase family)
MGFNAMQPGKIKRDLLSARGGDRDRSAPRVGVPRVSRIADLADAAFCYLTTTGRTSRRPHRIEIWFVAHADGAYLLSNSVRADWYRNLETEPSVVLEIDGQRRETTARPVEATDQANRRRAPRDGRQVSERLRERPARMGRHRGARARGVGGLTQARSSTTASP